MNGLSLCGAASPVRTRPTLAMDAKPETPQSPEEHTAKVIAEVVHMLRGLPDDVFKQVVAKLHLLPGRMAASAAQDDPPQGVSPTPAPQRRPQTQVMPGQSPTEVLRASESEADDPEGKVAMDAMFPDHNRLISTDHGARIREPVVRLTPEEERQLKKLVPKVNRIRRI